jgi:hypothetical protein
MRHPGGVTRAHPGTAELGRAMRQRSHSRFDDIALDVLAAAWLVRGAWRVRQGRMPWQPRSSRRRRR